MKVFKILALSLLIIIIGNSLCAQSARTFSNRVSISLSIGIPSASYGLATGILASSDFRFNKIYGFQFGSRWYIHPGPKFGMGIYANWVDFNIGIKITDNQYYRYERYGVDFSFLTVGPIATISLTNDLTIDAYYNLRPTIFESSFILNNSSNYDYLGSGISHVIGSSIRWKVLNAGLDFIFGSVYCSEMNSSNNSAYTNFDLSQVRLKIGVKF